MIGEFIAQKIIEAAIDTARNYLKGAIELRNERRLQQKKDSIKNKESVHKIDKEPGESGINVELSQKERVYFEDVRISSPNLIGNIEYHQRQCQQWSSIIGFSEMRGVKYLNEIYISLDLYNMPARKHLDEKERQDTISLEMAIQDFNEHCIILGQPGAGKTTSVKKICQSFFEDKRNNLEFNIKRKYSFPIVIRLRELKKKENYYGPIMDELAAIFSLNFEIREKDKNEQDRILSELFAIRRDTLIKFIDSMRPLILLDGFDEAPSSIDRGILVDEIRYITLSLQHARLILTSRVGEFDYNVESFRRFELATMSETQISKFAMRWMQDSHKAHSFINEINSTPYGGAAAKPLTLALLCAIYERIGKIPDRPKTIYRKIVGLLIEDWDFQRSVQRKSLQADFESDRKFEFLCYLSYLLTTMYRASVFQEGQIYRICEIILPNFRIPNSEIKNVVVELESHTGLFIQFGEDRYTFSHKSIQEYLCAEHIVKLPSLPNDSGIVIALGAELAIAVAISSDSGAYLYEVVVNIFQKNILATEFYNTFLNRLVVEVPEIHGGDRVVIALSNVLSLWLNKGSKTEKLSQGAILTPEAEKLFKNVSSLLSGSRFLETLKKYYDFKSPVDVRGDLLYLRKISQSERFVIPELLVIPHKYIDKIRDRKVVF